jgi:hypothetical protein
MGGARSTVPSAAAVITNERMEASSAEMVRRSPLDVRPPSIFLALPSCHGLMSLQKIL